MNTQESNGLAAHINAVNARRTARAEAAVNFLVALVIGLIMAVALLHWATPCADATMCLAAVTPTLRSPVQRLLDWFAMWRLRWHIRNAQQALAWQHEQADLARWELDHLPRAMAVTRGHIDMLEAQLQALTGNRGL